ncbi:uncharacterized protein B0T15DRAFT_488243 [Chaetomium strumarium]|uniref:Uncharacterized protein n=1 Tax=Chaetomium strumarium TaxID=1170767 RepID=A0AAJ0H130_9PEZI|nr:hypothetical protein B0T15DRAFT_488243 [Chaetomium strumarium]
MSPAQTRRPALATSFSTHNIFCRPIIPPPAPVVYVNGWDGVGKGTVSECLTLLLGRDKSLLIDVRSVGWDSVEEGRRGSTPRTNASPQKQHDQHPHFLLTPEHPRYSSFETDYGVNSIASPSLCQSPSSPSSTNQSASRPTSLCSSSSSLFTTTTTTTTTNTTTATKATIISTTTTTTPEWTTPCSSENLTRLLSHPANRYRIAVLPTCAPDTPGGRATLRTFEAAASRAGRLFVPVALTCSPATHAQRICGRSAGGLAADSAAGTTSGSGASRMMRLHLHRRGIGTGPGMGMGMGVGWTNGQGLATSMSTRALTVDTSSVTPFETALQIVEFVRALQAELEAELCSMGESTNKMPTNSLGKVEREKW